MRKPLKLIRNISKVFFPAFVAGTAYCFIEMWISRRPFMSFGLMLICIGMTLACANVQVWAEEQMLLFREAEIARETLRQVRNNDLHEEKVSS